MKYLKNSPVFILISLTAFFFFTNCKSLNSTSNGLDYLKVDEAQPLKGFLPFMSQHESIEHSMEFFYIPLNKINTAENTYDYSELEEKISEIAGRGHQSVLRVYLDYPEIDESDGTPSYFWDNGIEKKNYPYNGKTFYFPDYTNQKCINYLVDFINDFGKNYNGDPRIGFIFCGLIGHWGEWHNYYYYEATGNENMPSEEQQNQLYKAFAAAFDKTFTLTRKPGASELSNLTNIGFHDDSFTEDTIGSRDYYFMPQLTAFNMTERWKTAPIGGEFRPENQEPFLKGCKYADYYQDYEFCVNQTHCSWLLFEKAFDSELTNAEKKTGWEASKKLGYDFTAKNVDVRLNASKIQVSMEIENTGTAPFYYNWQPDLVLAKNGKIICSLNNSGIVFDNWDLPSIIKNSGYYSGEFSLPEEIAAEGTHLCFAIKNPMENGIPLKLSNMSLNQDLKGYITLKDF